MEDSFVAQFPFFLKPFVLCGLMFRHMMEPIGEPLHTLFSPVYHLLYKIGGSLGLKEDQVIFVLMLLATYPLSLVYRLTLFKTKLPKRVKELYMLGIGLFICFFVFGYTGWHALISALVSWILMTVGGRRLSFLVFFWAWGYLSVTHMIRMVTDYEGVQVDYSAMLMMMTLRIVSIAFNYADWENRDNLDKSVADKAIEKFPDLISYLSYNFYFPALLAGPTFDYKDYDEFLQDYPSANEPVETRPNIVAVIYNFFMILISFAVFSQTDKYPRELVMHSSDKFSQMTFVQKMIFLQLCVILFRFRYYLVWYIAQGACLLTGFGYDTKTKKWNKLKQVDLFGYEFATSPYWLAASWNISVHYWLKNYAYLRNKKKGHKPSTLQVFESFMVSAAWHGFYPGYYIFFFLCGIGVDCGRRLRNLLRHHFFDKDKDEYRTGISDWSVLVRRPTVLLYNFIGWLLTSVGTNYIACSFVFLSAEKTFFYFRETYYCIVIIAIVVYAQLLYLEPRYGIKRQEKRKKE